MLINLSEVLSEQHKTIVKDCTPDMVEFRCEFGRFPIAEKKDAHIVVEHVKGKELMIRGTADITITIPCDRCLQDVPTRFELDFVKNVDLDESNEARVDELDEKNYIDGYYLDVDKLL